MKVWQSIKNFFSKFFKQAIQQQLEIIIPIARDAVRMVAADPSILTSDEKRARGIAMILTDLSTKQLTFAKSLINLALEIAVVEMKQNQE